LPGRIYYYGGAVVALPELDTEPKGAEREAEPLLAFLPRALAGDPLALRTLVSALAPDVTRVARAMVGGSAADLDDVVQDALLGLVHALPSFRGDCSLRRFANRIAVRTALIARRRAHAYRHKQQVFHEHERAQAPPRARGSNPDEVYLASRRHALLCRLLDELPEAQAETLALRVVLGLSLEETAAATSVPINTVRSRIRLAREALRARIEAEPALRELLEEKP
jgi:RNA polymerase sigma factor (sigma-70 family)